MKKAKDLLFLLTLEPLVSSGRIGRIKYLLLTIWSYCSIALCTLATHFPEPADVYAMNVLGAIALFYIFAAGLCLGIRRLHDMGLSGVLIVLAGLIWPLMLLWPGQPRDNRYGPRLSPATT